MQHFISVHDLEQPLAMLYQAQKFKKDPLMARQFGQGKTLGLLFFNSSLRTRLSVQKAALNLGLSVMIINVNQDSWNLELEDGSIMNMDRAEHIKEAAAVIGSYCDFVGVRAFAKLENRAFDYQEVILQKFKQYAGVPILNLESSSLHPLQSFADWLTLEEHRPKHRPKIVVTWAPHPKALPQAVVNSFLEWTPLMNAEIVLTHPKGYELAPKFVQNCTIEYNQEKAFEGADFIYAKNWSSFKHYGQVLNQDASWRITTKKMQLTNQAKFMHCLPIRRNVIAEDAVLDSSYALHLQQATNRCPTAQAVLFQLLSNLKNNH
ncbi:N-acetylornithine carbamoyltransferase [Aureispira anguillae]|uniref:N-succinylornithine carbamoyltransferase n=1 Tax=Aureispira anguillae TaxID=2864201 RepID=A0A915YIR1_9BACT|nr:N-acetylornithine carbamoyltransferase [Aureispira anguillae]BDS13919.1 N-acetylornithine carbamoyltransferase [Aureispira anguillae]